jgi:hypothetical protein
MTQSIEHQMIEIYCFIDDYLKAHPRCAKWRRSPHSEPRFTDAEVRTIAFLQGSFQVASLKHTYRWGRKVANHLFQPVSFKPLFKQPRKWQKR